MKDAHIRGKTISTDEIKNLIVQGDNIDTIRFIIARTYKGIDLFDYEFRVKFQLPSGNGDFTDPLDIELSSDESLIYILWDVSGWPTSESGKLLVQLQATKEGKVFQTTETTLHVSRGLTLENLPEFSPQGLATYLAEFQLLLQQSEGARDDAQTARNQSESARDLSISARDKSQEWAENPEDEEVEPGEFSSKHHASKAAASAAAAMAADAAANKQITVGGVLYQYSLSAVDGHIKITLTEVV